MKPNQIPISTAAWDPKWFHKFGPKSHLFRDSNGVLNGLRSEVLSPENLAKEVICCPCNLHRKLDGSCKFLSSYYEYLSKLDFDNVIHNLIKDAKYYSELFYHPDPKDIILIVYETPDNPCSERQVLVRWFKDNGVELKEWEK